MLSIPDMAVLGAAALLFFGPEQLPRVARKAGGVIREIQNTSQSFIRELERAADLQDATAAAKPYEPPAYDPIPYDAPASYEPASDATYDPAAEHDSYAADDAPTVAMRSLEPPAPAPERPAGASVGEKLADPRPALNAPDAEPYEPKPHAPTAYEPDPHQAEPQPAPTSAAAQAAPQIDHSAHL